MTRPFPLTIASLIVAIEGAVIVGLGLFMIGDAAMGNASDNSRALLLAVLAVTGGVGLLWCSLGLRRSRRWSRSPSLLWQMLSLAVGVPALSSDVWWVGVATIALALVAGLILVLPTTTQALHD